MAKSPLPFSYDDPVRARAKTARVAGLRFGVTNHSGHAWHWFQTAYGYDPEGPMAGVPYDGWLTKGATAFGTRTLIELVTGFTPPSSN